MAVSCVDSIDPGTRLPVILVDLDSSAGTVAPLRLPSCPLVAFGDPRHPLATFMDTVVDTRREAVDLALASIARAHAAMVATQLLRMIVTLPSDDALAAESLAYATLQASAAHRTWMAARPAVPASAPGTVTLDRDRSDVLTVTLDRPAAGNAIDRPMRDALHEAFALANADETIERVVLRARGKAFCLGADLAEFGTTTDPAEAHRIRSLTLPAREAVRCARRLEAQIDGACIGAGLELAAFAQRLTATRRSWFQLPELAMGILPGAGGCVSLSRRIGPQRTLQMILSGRRVGAAKALEWGLVDALVD